MCLIIKVIFLEKKPLIRIWAAKATAQPRTSISPIFNWKESAAVNKYKPVVATAMPSTMKMVAFVLKDKG